VKYQSSFYPKSAAMACSKVTSLGEFNKNSAKIGHFLVKIYNGKLQEYAYEQKQTKAKMTANKFECILVGDNPSDYMLGFVKGTKKQAEDAKKQFKDNTVWKLSKSCFDTWTAAAYISTPKPFRINLGTSTLAAVSEQEGQAMPLAPVPPRTIAETVCISTSKTQDVLCLVKAVINRRTTKTHTVLVDAILIDGTVANTDSVSQPVAQIGDAGKVALSTILVTIWGEKKVDKTMANVGKPLAFFNLNVKLEAGNRVINHYEDAEIMDAPNCEKTDKLLAESSNLLDESIVTNQLSSQSTFAHQPKDVSGPQPLSCAAFMDFTSQESSADMPEVLQLPWLMVEEPGSSDPIHPKDGSRLWFVAKCRDASGAFELGCPEKVAFELTQTTTRAEFETKHAAGALGFPLFVHARISRTRKPSNTGSGSSQSNPEYVSHVLEEFASISWTKSEAPNASFTPLVAVLNNLPQHEECARFVFLKDLQEDPHYGFKIHFDGQPVIRAAYAVVLIESKSPSVTAACGDGFKVTTENVRDIAFIGIGDASDVTQLAQQEYTVVGYSSIDGVVKLDPPRGKKSRFAVLVVDRIEGKTLHMQKAEYVEQSDAEGAIHCFSCLRALCQKILPPANMKRTHTHAADFSESPNNMKKCKTLRSIPTDESMDAAK
jgi:hypothetical protein